MIIFWKKLNKYDFNLNAHFMTEILQKAPCGGESPKRTADAL